MNETSIRCLECGWETDTFQAECGDCGCCEWRRTDPGTDQSAGDGVNETISRLSRPFNPMTPR